MKFGEYLRTQKAPEWQDYYIDYDQLKQMIKELEEIHLAVAPVNQRTGECYNISPIALRESLISSFCLYF